MKVEYRPRTNTERNTELGISVDQQSGEAIYYNGNGSPGNPVPQTGNAMTSSNHHVITVFAKQLQLQKINMQGNPIMSDAAVFALYATNDAGEKTGNPVAALTANQPDAWTNVTGDFPVGTYILEETHVPAGYNPIAPMTVVVATAEGSSQKVIDDATDAGKPIGYNWTQVASISITGTTFANAPGQEVGAAATSDSETAAVQYQVKNPEGKLLPNTGGPGTGFVYLLGAVLVVLAAGALLRRRLGSPLA